MLEIKIDDEGITKVHYSSSPSRLLGETIAIIKTIYEGLKEDNEFAAFTYKNGMENNIKIAFLSDEKVEEEMIKRMGDMLEELKKMREEENQEEYTS